ncbi:hypothetical protein [Pseudomonas sp. RIT-To-2]|uniref:hypothetical protein n=1 Tax=Pseudomonas sp. RIT-To-2 TaxID=3462541 RepID=UPI002412F51C
MNEDELAALNNLVAALQAQTTAQTALSQSIQQLAQSNHEWAQYLRSRDPATSDTYLDGAPAP